MQNGRRVGGGQYSLAGCTLDGSYPTGYSKDQKRSFKSKAKLNFRVKSGVLYLLLSCMPLRFRQKNGDGGE